MRTAEMSDTVAIHYFCRRPDGTPLETTLQGPPAEITLGEGVLLPALEQAVVGMAPGDVCRLVLPPERAFGEYRDELVGEVPRAHLAEDVEPQPGMMVEVSAPDEDEPMQGLIVEIVGDDSVIIDGNHPLAGETLEYELRFVGFIDAQNA
jgi:FKBP-type peptidyl-prolyl cis-trans isomerase 2